MKCLSCLTEKDPKSLERYPYSDRYDGIDTETPGTPLCLIECQSNHRIDNEHCEFRMAVMCYECWHRLAQNTHGIDMWISERCWDTLNPKTPFSKLPKTLYDNENHPVWDPEAYEEKT
jgi:hypothetical protein